MVAMINNKNHLNQICKSQKLADIFYDICMLLTNELPSSYDRTTYNHIDLRINRLTGYITRECDLETGNKLIELRDAIKEEMNNAYLTGKSEGKNLLKMLNNGDITLNDFEQK